jgi:hypothetical protein
MHILISNIVTCQLLNDFDLLFIYLFIIIIFYV